MRILVLGINYAPEPIGIAVYTTGLCEALARSGHEVRVVAAQPYYPGWRVLPGFGRWRTTREQDVAVTRCPLYVPAVPSGIRRLLHLASFAATALLPMLREALRFRPDVVLTIAPSLASAPVALLAARLAGAKSWLHIQDFEVEAAFATGLIDETSRLARIARRFEHGVVRMFDRVSSISAEMCARLRRFGIPEDRIVEFRNWADIDRIRPLSAPSAFRTEWSIGNRKVALYAGNIANKQGIEVVIDAAKLLQHRADIVFVICGEGPNRVRLEQETARLPNVILRDLQPIDRLSELLSMASVHLLPQKGDAADLVLPSKLTNMLASGRPVVATAAPGTGLAREIEGCGIRVAPEDAAGMAEGILTIVDSPALQRALGEAARRRAEAVWSKDSILAQVTADLASLARG